MKKLKYTRMILDLFMPGPRKTKDDPVVVNDGGVRRPYEINTDGAVMGALLGRVNGGESTEEDLSAPAYDYTPGSFGYGPFTYGDFSYKDQALLDAAKQKVNNFSYNPDEDTSYKAYARQYTRNGEDALRNTMARLASRTGGVASSYAVQAAQGAYNNYMQELANKVPELSELAYQKLQNEYNLYNNEYNRDLAKWKADRDFAYDQYEDARDIAFKNFQLQEAARQKAYDQRYNADRAAYESRLTDRQNAESAADVSNNPDYTSDITILKDYKKGDNLAAAYEYVVENFDGETAEQLLKNAGINPKEAYEAAQLWNKRKEAADMVNAFPSPFQRGVRNAFRDFLNPLYTR